MGEEREYECSFQKSVAYGSLMLLKIGLYLLHTRLRPFKQSWIWRLCFTIWQARLVAPCLEDEDSLFQVALILFIQIWIINEAPQFKLSKNGCVQYFGTDQTSFRDDGKKMHPNCTCWRLAPRTTAQFALREIWHCLQVSYKTVTLVQISYDSPILI